MFKEHGLQMISRTLITIKPKKENSSDCWTLLGGSATQWIEHELDRLSKLYHRACRRKRSPRITLHWLWVFQARIFTEKFTSNSEKIFKNPKQGPNSLNIWLFTLGLWQQYDYRWFCYVWEWHKTTVPINLWLSRRACHTLYRLVWIRNGNFWRNLRFSNSIRLLITCWSINLGSFNLLCGRTAPGIWRPQD